MELAGIEIVAMHGGRVGQDIVCNSRRILTYGDVVAVYEIHVI